MEKNNMNNGSSGKELLPVYKELADIPGLLVYYDGRIKYKQNGKAKKISKQEDKRFVTHLGKKYYVHRLVARAFVPNPDHKELVVHKDGNSKNNHFKNLFWANQGEAQTHNHKIGKLKPTYAKLTREHVDFIRSQLKKGIPGSILAKQFNISEMQITRIKRHENWK
jgi:hypothetical protein